MKLGSFERNHLVNLLNKSFRLKVCHTKGCDRAGLASRSSAIQAFQHNDIYPSSVCWATGCPMEAFMAEAPTQACRVYRQVFHGRDSYTNDRDD